jgi:hypothetical protein
VRTMFGSSVARASRPLSLLAASAAAVLAVTSFGAAAASPTAASIHAAVTAKPGLTATTITLSKTVELTQNSYDLATDKAGTAYLGWIATDHSNEGAGELIHSCVLPLHATKCAGGEQTTSPGDSLSPADLKIITPPGGPVTFVWYDGISGTSEIVKSTVQPNHTLSPAIDIATAPTTGELLDAELGPDGTIWTVSAGDSGNTIEVHDGVANPAKTIATPKEVDFARLAFAGKTGIIAMHDGGADIDPVHYTYLSGGSWSHVASVAHTQTGDADLGLVTTKSGVRLLASQRNAGLRPVIAKWTGHSFSTPVVPDPKAVFNPVGHDLVADASGRAADVSYIGANVTVSNFADTTHGAAVSFRAGGTGAGGYAQIATNPRGEAWVAWAVEAKNASNEDVLRVAQLLLPGLHRRVTKHGAHGSVTVTGPASCLPADSISVGVKGHAKHGWKVGSHKLLLGHKRIGKSLNGASLKAGKKYTLKGTVIFAKGHAHSTVSATVSFKACPNP